MPLQTVLEQLCSSIHIHPLHASPRHFSQESWSQLKSCLKMHQKKVNFSKTFLTDLKLA
jgi:hypothetical protein